MEREIRQRKASFYHSLTVIGSALIFVAGILLISFGIGYAFIALFLTIIGMTFAKKLEEELYSNKAQE